MQRWPSTLILFGGANFEGEMGRELTTRLDFIDYAIDGEADEAFPEFLNAVASDEDPASVPGVVAGCCRLPDSAGAASREDRLSKGWTAFPPPTTANISIVPSIWV